MLVLVTEFAHILVGQLHREVMRSTRQTISVELSPRILILPLCGRTVPIRLQSLASLNNYSFERIHGFNHFLASLILGVFRRVPSVWEVKGSVIHSCADGIIPTISYGVRGEVRLFVNCRDNRGATNSCKR